MDCLDSLYEERREPEVYGLRTSLLRKDVIAMILLLCGVLRIVNHLSLFLQNKNINLTDVSHKVSETLEKLDNLIENLDERGQHEELTFSNVDEFYLEVIDRTSLQRRIRYAEHRNAIVKTPEDFLLLSGLPFIRSLRGEIEEAFSFLPVLRSFGVLDPRNLPDTIRELPDYGKVCMNIVNINYLQKFSGLLFHYFKYIIMILIFIAGHLEFGRVLCTSLPRNPC